MRPPLTHMTILAYFPASKTKRSTRMPSAKPARSKNRFAYQLVRRHFAPFAAERLVTTSRHFSDRLRMELAAPLAALDAGVGAAGFSGLLFRGGDGGTFSNLLVEDEDPVLLASSHFQEIEFGATRVRCLKNGLWLGGSGAARYAVLFTSNTDFNGEIDLRIEIAVMPGAAGEREVKRLLARFDTAMREAKAYRGRVLSFERQDRYSYAGVKAHAIAQVARASVILPQSTLDLIDRNIIRFAAQRAALAALGLPVKKGVLFYGPPGTGKTHTIQYIVSALKDATTFLVTAEETRHLKEYTALARLLQPAVIVIEDVDLIAEDRDSSNDHVTQGLLNRLLNEMDGLNEDAEILFILTTNRPEALEAALAARPGRIDQAIEFPLPDEACRRALIRLYAGRMQLDEATIDTVTRRTKGVTASFIKELMRRAAQAWIEAGAAATISCELFISAIEEMTVAGGRFNAKLLGAGDAIGFVRAA